MLTSVDSELSKSASAGYLNLPVTFTFCQMVFTSTHELYYNLQKCFSMFQTVPLQTLLSANSVELFNLPVGCSELLLVS